MSAGRTPDITLHVAVTPNSTEGSKSRAIKQVVRCEPRLRALHQAFILSGCRDSRGHLNRYADCLGLMRNLQENEQLLTGLAFENLIKGILIQRDTTLVTWEKIESGILPRGGHGISTLRLVNSTSSNESRNTSSGRVVIRCR